MGKYRLGVDLGGTSIKGGILDESGKVLFTKVLDTQSYKGNKFVLDRMAELVNCLILDNGFVKQDFDSIGVGSPGIVDDTQGVVIFAANLGFCNVEVVKTLQSKVGLPFKIANDANAAALGEVMYGGGMGFKDAVLITLGTGVGGGVVIDGKIFSGNQGAGTELGHMIIAMDGRACTCGQKGCLEAYCSATALIARTREILQQNKNSKMWTVLDDLQQVNAKLTWDFCNTDSAANQLIKDYVHSLTIGLVNFANIFRPQVILIGGGISYQGDNLLNKIKGEFDKGVFGGIKGPKVELRIAKLKNDAGFIGAACL